MSTHYDMTDDDLARAVIGKTVISIDEDSRTLTLGNGTVLAFEDTSDCCAWFKANLRTGNLTDNAVTAVKREARQPEGEWAEAAWTLHILAADHRIAAVEISGYEGSGYHCHSINLTVKEANAA